MYIFGFREYAIERVEGLSSFQEMLSSLMALVADLAASI